MPFIRVDLSHVSIFGGEQEGISLNKVHILYINNCMGKYKMCMAVILFVSIFVSLVQLTFGHEEGPNILHNCSLVDPKTISRI